MNEVAANIMIGAVVLIALIVNYYTDWRKK